MERIIKKRQKPNDLNRYIRHGFPIALIAATIDVVTLPISLPAI
jgi:hypothetical protein